MEKIQTYLDMLPSYSSEEWWEFSPEYMECALQDIDSLRCDIDYAKEKIKNLITNPVYVVWQATSYSSSDTLEYGLNKVFRDKQSALNWIVNKLRNKDHYMYKSDEELEDIADYWVYEMEVTE